MPRSNESLYQYIFFHRSCPLPLWHIFINGFFQEAKMKDILERTREPNLNLKEYLQNAYLHPVFKGGDDSDSDADAEELELEPTLVPTKRISRKNTPVPSRKSLGSAGPLLYDAQGITTP